VVDALLDSTLIVDLLRNYLPAAQWFESQRPRRFGVTAIVMMEVLAGAPSKEKQRSAFRLLSNFERLYLTESDQQWAVDQVGKYSTSHGAGVTDCLIASVSHRLNVPLYTHNLKHFAPLLGHWRSSPTKAAAPPGSAGANPCARTAE
jgi:predicted nucleic acid-binding protein